jgi:hypothetical protein
MTDLIEPADVGEKGIRDFPRYDHNPFLPGLHVRARGKTVMLGRGREYGLFDRGTGEVLNETAVMATRHYVDQAEFVKVFKGQMRALFNLSPSAVRVFCYLMEATRASDDRIVFSLKKCMAYTEYASKGTVTGAMAELLRKEFIARTDEPNIYYLNPAVFFNGDRLVVVQDYVRKGSRVAKELQEHDARADFTLNQHDLENHIDRAERAQLAAPKEGAAP